MAGAVEKYLAGHSEPEARLAALIDGDYARVLVVPVRGEQPRILDNVAHCAGRAQGRTLLVVVLNGQLSDAEPVRTANQRFFERFREQAIQRPLTDSAPAYFGTFGAVDVLLIHRARPGSFFSEHEGVGLARRIGADVALSLFAQGRAGPWFFQTDADASLPDDYFERVADADAAQTAAVCFPYWHERSADFAISRATALYEVSLRYYVAGLCWAGSPYAFHTIGSSIGVSAEAYAAVRGHPRRLAGEDFYLLNKAAKVAAVRRLSGAPIRLLSRRSDRTPFGTGRSADRIAASGEIRVYDPRCFDTLRAVLGSLDGFSHDGRIDRLKSSIVALDGPEGATVLAVLSELDAWRILGRLSGQLPAGVRLQRAVHTWFDAFRTRRLIHALRDRTFPNRPLQAAIEAAAFVCHPFDDEDPEAVSLRNALRMKEEQDSSLLGPTMLERRSIAQHPE